MAVEGLLLGRVLPEPLHLRMSAISIVMAVPAPNATSPATTDQQLIAAAIIAAAP